MTIQFPEELQHLACHEVATRCHYNTDSFISTLGRPAGTFRYFLHGLFYIFST